MMKMQYNQKGIRFCEISFYHFDDLKYINRFNIIDIAVA